MKMHSNRNIQITTLIVDKVSIIVIAEYSDFANVFPKESAMVLPEYTKINTHAIDLEKNKQLPYGSIYSLVPLKLEILKTFIETNLANGFIHLFKSLAGASILFNKKSDRNFWLYINCQDFNNITIKN